jgi:hypothetical protein
MSVVYLESIRLQVYTYHLVKVKVIPLQARCGPEGG